MLSASNIVQTAQGSTGSTNASQVTLTLPAPTAAGNQLVIAVAAAAGVVGGVGHIIAFPSPFVDNGQVDTNAPVPHLRLGSKATTAGESSWTVHLTNNNGSAATDAMCWWIAEVSGLHAYPSIGNAGAGGTDGGSATTLTVPNNSLNGSADELDIAAFVNHIASGTPKTVSSIANDVSQPGTWARLGSTVATSNTTGANVRLDVFDKFPGAVGVRGAKVTWSASVTGAGGLVESYTA
jgi:hypothetical protein